MRTKAVRSVASPRRTRAGKVRKAFWLDPRLLKEARVSLAATSDAEAVEVALDLVRFRHELVKSTAALASLQLSRID